MGRGFRHAARRLSLGLLATLSIAQNVESQVLLQVCDVLSYSLTLYDYVETNRLNLVMLTGQSAELRKAELMGFLTDPANKAFYPEIKESKNEQIEYQEKKALEYFESIKTGQIEKIKKKGKREMIGREKFFVALNKETNDIIGTIAVDYSPGGVLCVIKYAINTKFKGQKYGKEMVAGFVNHLEREGDVQAISALPLKENKPSISILLSQGFEILGDVGIDRVEMKKRLDSK